MSAIPRFWPASRAAARRRVSRRGFFAVAGVHLAAVAGVFLLSAGPTAKITVAAGRKDTASASAVNGAPEPPLTPAEREAVVWMDPATFEAPPAAAPPEPPAAPEPDAATPEPPPRHPVREPFLSPTPRPVPKRSTAASVAPRKTPPSPTPPVRARTTVRPRPQSSPIVRRTAAADNAPDGATTGRGTTGAGGGDAGDNDGPTGAGGTDWYASMLHERFYARWEQPTSVFASAQRYTATLRLRIERDGRISDFRLVRPSGLVPMDESVLAAAARVSRVDPPPAGLLRGGAYVVNVGFVRE